MNLESMIGCGLWGTLSAEPPTVVRAVTGVLRRE